MWHIPVLPVLGAGQGKEGIGETETETGALPGDGWLAPRLGGQGGASLPDGPI